MMPYGLNFLNLLNQPVCRTIPYFLMNILFAIQKQSGEQSSQDLGQNPVVQKWWAYMTDIMETNADNSPVSIPLEEVFHMD
jgi:L-rhamnose mutarotase